MTNPDRIPDDEDPLLRPASPGEPADAALARQRSWRERHPGWETFEGKPHDPRFEAGTDPERDPRYNTDLNSAAVLPRKTGVALWVWLVFVGIVLLILFGFAMYIRFQTPSPRSPSQHSSEVRWAPIRRANVVLADLLLPLRQQHRSDR